jgi:serine/threonine-protein kinase
MTLERGARLGPYEVLEFLGAGGMGAVYKALDRKLGREVAVKLLLDDVKLDSERLARFRREARLLAQVNHPNIATVYGFEEADGTALLVMELVEGETLADRIARGRLPWEVVLPLAVRVADALEAAHERGIIHRDLKPGNLKLTPEGAVKVLDFGLAKPASEGASAASLSPTLSRPATEEGVILGTVSYMSPEQARGLTVDRRTDIWAYGCVVFEALAGKPAFAGDTVTDILASVVGSEPDWSALPEGLPRSVIALLRSTLRKEPRMRLRDIGDARLLLESLGDEADEELPRGAAPPKRVFFGAILLALMAGAATGFLVGRGGSKADRVAQARFEIGVPNDQRLFSLGHLLAISPDGRHLVYVTIGGIYHRTIDGRETTLVPGTERSGEPFFSPDSKWLGFWKAGELRKVALAGGAPITLCRAQRPLGVSWGEDGRIVFGQGLAGIFEVSSDGGEARPLARPEPAQGEVAFHGPELLPGGEELLFTLLPAGRNWDRARIVVERLDTKERKTLVEEATDARYLRTGHLVFARGKILMATAFDRGALETRGPPVPLMEGVSRAYLFSSGASQFDFADDGTLVYVEDVDWHDHAPVWVDRTGVEAVLPAPPRRYQHARLSPDETRAVVDTMDTQDLWLYELQRGTMSRLTVEQTFLHPVWTPDGSRVVFDSTQGHALYWTSADGGASPELLLSDADAILTPVSVSPDGRYLAFERTVDYVSFDIGVLPLEGDRIPRSLIATSFKESGPMFSPDGRFLAYVSNETGEDEVYVQPFPGPGAKYLVSKGGGREPVWSRDGRQIFYRAGRAMMALGVETRNGFAAGTPRKLFEGSYNFEPLSAHPVYDVSRDGRFLMVKSLSPPQYPNKLGVVLGWFEDVKARVPARPE